MNRIIKFRLWDTISESMLDWEEIIKNGLRIECLEGETNLKWMQFTGLTDKNGTEIYEGDICQIMLRYKYGHSKDGVPGIVGAVAFGEVCPTNNTLHDYNVFHINGRSIKYLIGQELEIIGNIHSNPDLICT